MQSRSSPEYPLINTNLETTCAIKVPASEEKKATMQEKYKRN